MESIVAGAPVEQRSGLAANALDFLRELLSAFETTFRGHHEAPTCSAGSTSSRSGRRSPTSPSPRCRSGSTSRCGPTPQETGTDPADVPMDLAVIGMGRLGGGEMGFGSDADVMFVHRPREGADEAKATAAANAVAHTLRRLLGEPAPDPAFEMDADLRPEGRQGALVRSLSAFREYYERWVSVWEVQALLRAVPVAGDEKLGAEFVELIDPIRYPAEGLTAEQVAEIRRIKARVERERLPRGADPATHTKLGRGGLSDVEWTVQLLQLQHAADIPELRVPSTVEGLRARRAGLLDAEQPEALRTAWELATRARNAIFLVRGRPSDQLPARAELAGVARACGYGPDLDAGQFVEDYRRITRRARGRGGAGLLRPAARAEPAGTAPEVPGVSDPSGAVWLGPYRGHRTGARGAAAAGPEVRRVSHSRPFPRRRVHRDGAARDDRGRLGRRRHRQHRRVRCRVRLRPHAAGARLRHRPDLRVPHQPGGDPRRAALPRDDRRPRRPTTGSPSSPAASPVPRSCRC